MTVNCIFLGKEGCGIDKSTPAELPDADRRRVADQVRPFEEIAAESGEEAAIEGGILQTPDNPELPAADMARITAVPCRRPTAPANRSKDGT